MGLPLVSIIIPTYNRAKLVGRAIKSVVSQTWQGNMEIIIVSDGSTDSTEKMIISFNDPRINFIKHKKSRGPSAARNTGLLASNANYIAFLDDDDEWMPNKLEIQIPVIMNSGPEVGLVYTWMEYVDGDNTQEIRKPTLRGNLFLEMLDKQAITGCSTIIIKREVLDIIPAFDESLPRGNDGDFIRRISRHFDIECVPEVLCKYHIENQDRISINTRKNMANVVLALEKRLESFALDFSNNQDKKVKVLIDASLAAIKSGQYLKGIGFLKRAMFCRTQANVKVLQIGRFLKDVSSYIVKGGYDFFGK